MIRDDEAGRSQAEAAELDGRGHRMRSLFDEILGLDADARTEALRAAAARDGLDDELVEEVRALLAFVDATRIDGDEPPTNEDRPERLLGCRLGAFTLERLVGIGGTAAVFEATQDRPRRTVAVKVLRHAIGGRRAKRRFEREIEIAGRLEHPAIARVYDSGSLEVDGVDTPWLAMEYVVEARTLTAHAHDRGLGSRQRVELVRAALAGVAAAHRRGVIHRDLKPANILVDAKGRVRVIDFGIARQASGPVGSMTATTPGQVIGTVPFMAPEQLGGDPEAVDVRTDVYAIGVVLHLLLTRRMPYEIAGCDFLEAARRIREVEVGSLRRLDPAVDRDLDGIVQKALAKDPATRYQTIEALDADLAAWFEGLPVQARPLSTLARGLRLARRRPLPTTLAAVAVVSIVATIVVLAVMLARESTLRIRADRAVMRSSIAAGAAALDRGDMGGLARHLNAVPEQERGWEYDWLLRLSDDSDVVLAGLPGDVISVDIVPPRGDRPAMVLATGYRGTRAHDLATFEERWVLPEFSKGGCWKHSLLPDGERVLVCGLAEGLVIADLDTGQVLQRLATDGAIGSMWPLDDDRVVLGGDDGTLTRLNLETGEIDRRVALDHGGITSMLGLADGRILCGTMRGPLLEMTEAIDDVRAVRNFGRMIPRLRADSAETRLAVCTTGDVVELVDPDDYETIAIFDDHDADVWDARFDEAGGRLVTACNDESIRVFDLDTGAQIQQLSGPYDFVWSLALEADGRHAWFGSKDGAVRRRSLLEAMPVVPAGEVAEAVAWSPAGDRIAFRTDRGVHLLDVETRRWVASVEHPYGSKIVNDVSGTLVWNARGIWCGGGEGSDAGSGGLRWFSPDLSASRQVMTGVSVTAMHSHPDGGIVAAVVRDGRPEAVRIDPDGRVVVSASLERTVAEIEPHPLTGRWHALHYGRGSNSEVLDRDTLERVGDMTGWPIGASFDIAFAPGAARVAIGGRETPGNVLVFDPRDDPGTGRRTADVRRIGHTGDAKFVAFLDEGRRLVTGGDDGRVILGRPDDSEPILTMFDSRRAIRGLDVSPDGRALVATDGHSVYLAVGRGAGEVVVSRGGGSD